RIIERLLGRVYPEHVGAGNRLVQLAVRHEESVVLPDLCRHFDRPLGPVEPGERSHRRLAFFEPFPDLRDGGTRAADDPAPGDDDFFSGFFHAWTSSGWRKTSELFDPPKPSELERAARMRIGRGAPVMRFTSQSGSGVW